ncbi:hypothetical protein Tco_0125955, partial [Tanacetum coccineum]
IKLSTSASKSQPSGNIKKDKIQQTPSSTLKNKVEAHPKKVKSSLKIKDCVVAPKGTAHVQHSKLNANYEIKCFKYLLRKIQREKFGNQQERCLPILDISGDLLVGPTITLVYSRKPRKSKTNVPVSNPKILQSVSANKKEPNKSWGSINSDVPSSSLDACRSFKLSSGIWTSAAPSICVRD